MIRIFNGGNINIINYWIKIECLGFVYDISFWFWGLGMVDKIKVCGFLKFYVIFVRVFCNWGIK